MDDVGLLLGDFEAVAGAASVNLAVITAGIEELVMTAVAEL